jgi:Xaa-Pro dipeptidase
MHPAIIAKMDSRIARLCRSMRAKGVDAFFACTPVTMGYLHGLREDGHERLLILAISSDEKSRLICPALTATQASRCGIQDIRTWADQEDPMGHIRELESDWGLKSAVIAVDDEMRADIILKLQDALPAALFRAGEPVLSTVARVKDGLEIELLKRAADIADAAFAKVKASIKAGMTERQVSKLLTEAMESLGGKPTFCIVATGPNGAEPHHLTDDTVLNSGDVVILDFGCEVEAYQSDITRVLAIEHASESARGVYQTVLAAHHAARNAARAGVAAGNVDQAARQVIADAGFGDRFVHRTGHGIGQRVHEAPYISPGNGFVLEGGNCFSIEPGIYLPGEFGVRIENIVVARDDDSLSLNAEPAHELEIVG